MKRLVAVGGGHKLRRLVAAMTTDITPLRTVRAFRWLWIGQSVSTLGTQVTAVAVPLQVYDITGSSLAVGMVGLAGLLPLVLVGILGGAIVDAAPRRLLLLITSIGIGGTSVVLAVAAASGTDHVALLYACVALQSAFFAIDSPARRATIPRLLPNEQIPAAMALGQVSMNIGVIAGPMIAGVLIQTVGYAWAYAFDAMAMLAMVAGVAALPHLGPVHGAAKVGFRSIAEGFELVRRRPTLLGSFVLDLNAMIFGMPRALFPALAEHRFGGGEGTAGLLYAAPAVGALLAAVLGGWMSRVHRQGIAVMQAIVAWGIAIAIFGLCPYLVPALVLLAIAGAADVVSAVFRNAIMMRSTPDSAQGRLGGFYTVVVAGGPRLGDVESGSVAQVAGTGFSVVSGGLLCVIGVAIFAVLVPSFARYDTRRELEIGHREDVQQEPEARVVAEPTSH